MAPETHAVARATQTWLQTSWSIQVPSAWLEACVEWLQEEAGGPGRLLQQQVNQQAFDQWLMTDLKDLGHPVLPEGLTGALRTELGGTFCIQVDSVLDISQPAYGQLQKLKGTDVSNDEVSAVTQATQRPWEAKPTRMLLLQVTDGVQSLEAMEYQPVPALSTALRPGVKLQLQGQIVCRLGMLLLGPSNVKVLGGEVEDLVERNSGGKVLCRALGLPEEEGQQPQEEEVPLAAQQGNQELDDQELEDADLLASLEAQEEVERMDPGPDSGYWTLSNTSTQSARSSSTRSFISTVSSRSDVSAVSLSRRSAQSYEDASFRVPHNGSQQEPLVAPSLNRVNEHDMEDDNFPDDDFDDLPLDELDGVVFQESSRVAGEHMQRSDGIPGVNTGAAHVPSLGSNWSKSSTQKRDHQGCPQVAPQRSTTSAFTPSAPPPTLELNTNDEGDLMDQDMDCFFEKEQEKKVKMPTGTSPSAVQQGSNASISSSSGGEGASNSDRPSAQIERRGTASALTLTSPPFTYLHLLEEVTSRPGFVSAEVRLKAFIMTLLGKLSSSSGSWSIPATISDGTGYVDVELSDGVLAGLLGFSVSEKEAMKRQPAQRAELSAGMKRCQEELVDMCCVMTVLVKASGGKAVVTRAEPVSEKTLGELERRVKDGMKSQWRV